MSSPNKPSTNSRSRPPNNNNTNINKLPTTTTNNSIIPTLISKKTSEIEKMLIREQFQGGERIFPQEEEIGNIEYKFRLINITPERLEHLRTQMHWRLGEGNGEAVYRIGISDDGRALGLLPQEFEETIATLKAVIEPTPMLTMKIEDRFMGNRGECATVRISQQQQQQDYHQHLLVHPKYSSILHHGGDVPILPSHSPLLAPTKSTITATTTPIKQLSSYSSSGASTSPCEIRVVTCGHYESGKSTLLGVLTTGFLDDGRGRSRRSVAKHKHELTRGNTSSVTSHSLSPDIGILTKGMSNVFADSDVWSVGELRHSTPTITTTTTTTSSNTTTKQQRNRVALSLVDTAGHVRHLKSSLRGLCASRPHFCMITVSAQILNDENSPDWKITTEFVRWSRELGALIFFVVTKADSIGLTTTKTNTTTTTTTIYDQIFCLLQSRLDPPHNNNNSTITTTTTNTHKNNIELLHVIEEQMISTARDPNSRPMSRIQSLFTSTLIVAPVFVVSNVTGYGIPILKEFLNELGYHAPPIVSIHRIPPINAGLRMCIDVCYSLKNYPDVVVGTGLPTNTSSHQNGNNNMPSSLLFGGGGGDDDDNDDDDLEDDVLLTTPSPLTTTNATTTTTTTTTMNTNEDIVVSGIIVSGFIKKGNIVFVGPDANDGSFGECLVEEVRDSRGICVPIVGTDQSVSVKLTFIGNGNSNNSNSDAAANRFIRRGAYIVDNVDDAMRASNIILRWVSTDVKSRNLRVNEQVVVHNEASREPAHIVHVSTNSSNDEEIILVLCLTKTHLIFPGSMVLLRRGIDVFIGIAMEEQDPYSTTDFVIQGSSANTKKPAAATTTNSTSWIGNVST
jgi:GTPase